MTQSGHLVVATRAARVLRLRLMMSGYAALLDAVVLVRGQSVIAARGAGEHGRRDRPVDGWLGH